MDFEKAYAKYKDGTASKEEIAYVEQELERARKMALVIDEYESKRPIEQSCDAATIKRAQKRFATKNAMRALLVSVIVLVVVAAIVFASVFGTAFSSANKNCNVSQEQAKSIALAFVADHYGTEGVPVVSKCERIMDYSSDLAHSIYVYEVTVNVGLVYEVEIRVNAKTGLATLEDISRT